MADRKIRNVESIAKLSDDNEYTQFIESCRDKIYSENEKLQIHHIIPIHHGGKVKAENEIKLSFNDHVKAHEIRYRVYNQKGDYIAYNMMQGNEKGYIAQRQAGAKVVNQMMKNQKKTFFNTEFQKEMAKRSVAQDTGQRSAGGKKGGAKRWTNYIIIPEDRYVFFYQPSKNSPKEPKVCIFNCTDGTQVLNLLQCIVPNPKFIRASPLLTQERSYAYGWSCTYLGNGISMEYIVDNFNYDLFEQDIQDND